MKPFGKLSNVITILYNLKTFKIGEVLIKLLLMSYESDCCIFFVIDTDRRASDLAKKCQI